MTVDVVANQFNQVMPAGATTEWSDSASSVEKDNRMYNLGLNVKENRKKTECAPTSNNLKINKNKKNQ